MKTLLITLSLFISTFTISIRTFSQFGEQQLLNSNDNLPTSAHAADLDGDGDLDILTAAREDDDISWYENLTPIVNIEEIGDSELTLFPNPMMEESQIIFEHGCNDCMVRITNIFGQLIREYDSISGNQLIINREGLAAGTYVLQVFSVDESLKEFTLIVK